MGSSSVWRRGAAILECRFKKPLRSDDMTKIAAVILVGNAAEAERQARIALGKGADLVELRLDEIVDLGPKTIRHLAKSLGEHAIATNRSPGQGGAQRRWSRAHSPMRLTRKSNTRRGETPRPQGSSRSPPPPVCAGVNQSSSVWSAIRWSIPSLR